MGESRSILVRALGMRAALVAWVATAALACGRTEATPETRPQTPTATTLAVATFAGGCFWCMEPPFEKLAGVTEVVSGYSGGQLAKPTPEQVSAGGTGHAESVQVHYDPARVTYTDLL